MNNPAHHLAATQSGLDVLAFGETMLRFTPPGRLRLEQADTLQVHVGGSESNTAVGLARLGLRTGWISRLPRTALGRMVSGEIAKYGVDVQHVLWCEDDRLGLYFFEEAGPPRGSQVIYDRRDSAISRIEPQDFPSQLFETLPVRAFHTSGITLAISDSARRTATFAAEQARHAGALVSFDFNYRSRLWSPSAAAAGCQPLLHLANIIFIPERDAELVLQIGGSADPAVTIQRLAQLNPNAVWVMTRGREGSIAWSAGQVCRCGIFVSDEIGRLGGGDAFGAGFLARYLESQADPTPDDVADALRWGAATSALKYSIPGDLPLMTRDEVVQLLNSGSAESLRR